MITIIINSPSIISFQIEVPKATPKMSELPITTPPRRRDLLAHVQHAFSSTPPSSESNKKSLTRKLESYHHALLESGSQSAKSSPLPHRRLDKLEGVIRDKPVTPALCMMRRPFDASGDASSCESSPALLRKCPSNGSSAIDRRFINSHQESPMPYRKSAVPTTVQPSNDHYCGRRNTTDCGCIGVAKTFQNENGIGTPLMRRRVESDCSCSRKPVYGSDVTSMTKSECMCSPHSRRKIASPAKSVLGEPGCFSSPMHHRVSEQSGFGAFGSPTKSVLGEPGVFASPARSLCVSPPGEEDPDLPDTPLQPDQNIVSGWLKFRDNKRVS